MREAIKGMTTSVDRLRWAEPVSQSRERTRRWLSSAARGRVAIAGREPAKESPAILSRADLDHDVSILIAAGAAVGRARGGAPRWNVSMMTMRPPQHGQG